MQFYYNSWLEILVNLISKHENWNENYGKRMNINLMNKNIQTIAAILKKNTLFAKNLVKIE